VVGARSSRVRRSFQMALYLNTSTARKRFKDLLGNANHLLITILVGLSAVERKLIIDAPVELHAAWNPLNVISSARRSRVFVLESTLVRTSDALDAYMSWLRRAPALIQDMDVRNAVDAAGNSVLRKFGVIRKSVATLDPTVAALIEVMIAWRNRSVHSLAENDASDEAWKTIRDNGEFIAERFKALLVDRLESGFSHNEPPTFKETASFISVTHEIVRQIDEYYLSKLNVTPFLSELIWQITADGAGDDVDSRRKKRVQSVWGRDASERRNAVVSLLKNAGLSDMTAVAQSRKRVPKSDRENAPAAVFEDDLIDWISEFSPNQLLGYLVNTRDAQGAEKG
jgi:hypothetical protein